MAANEALVERVRRALGDGAEVREQRMFGGVCFTVQGNMALGVHNSDLIVRLDSAACEAALAKPYVRPFDIFDTRHAPKGWLLVAPAGTKTARSLGAWVTRARTSCAPCRRSSRGARDPIPAPSTGQATLEVSRDSPADPSNSNRAHRGSISPSPRAAGRGGRGVRAN